MDDNGFYTAELDILKLIDVGSTRAANLLHDSGYNDVTTARQALGGHLPYHCGVLSRLELLESHEDQRRLDAMGDDL